MREKYQSPDIYIFLVGNLTSLCQGTNISGSYGGGFGDTGAAGGSIAEDDIIDGGTF